MEPEASLALEERQAAARRFQDRSHVVRYGSL